MKTKSLTISLLSCSLAYGGVYVVRSGDTLSNILYNNVEGRIYGPEANLSKLLRANPSITNPNYIQVGQEINFPNSFKFINPIANSSDNRIKKSHKVLKKKEEYLEIVKNDNQKSDDAKASTKLNQSLFFGLNLNSESISSLETSTNESEIAKSDLAYGVSARWSHHWNKKLNFFMDTSISKYKFKVSTNKELSKADLTKLYGGVGLKYKYNPKHSFEFATGLGESFLLNSKSATELEIDKIVIPSISTSGSHSLKKFKSGYELQSFWRIGGLLPTTQSDYKTKFGTYWRVGAGSSYDNNGKKYNISVSYGQRSLKTDDVEQTNKDIAISAGVGFGF